MILTKKEAFTTKQLALKLLAKHLKVNKVAAGDMGVVLKSTTPRSRYGPSLKSIRDDLSRVRVVLQLFLNRE